MFQLLILPNCYQTSRYIKWYNMTVFSYTVIGQKLKGLFNIQNEVIKKIVVPTQIPLSVFIVCMNYECLFSNHCTEWFCFWKLQKICMSLQSLYITTKIYKNIYIALEKCAQITWFKKSATTVQTELNRMSKNKPVRFCHDYKTSCQRLFSILPKFVRLIDIHFFFHKRQI